MVTAVAMVRAREAVDMAVAAAARREAMAMTVEKEKAVIGAMTGLTTGLESTKTETR